MLSNGGTTRTVSNNFVSSTATSGVGVLGAYAYDDLGRRTLLTRGNGTTATYSYDNVSRLTQMVEDPGGTSYDQTLGFSYNPAGQIAATTRSNDAYAWTGHYAVNRNYTANGLNQYTASGSLTPTYDSRGNLQSAGSSSYYIYNSENMLTSSWNQATLSYDPLLRLFQISGATATRLLYDGATLIAEYDSGNSLLRRYVHGPGTDEPLVWYEGTGTSDRRFYHADERGSVVATSNGSGTLINVNTYDEYGIPGASNSGRFQYTGQQWLSDIGMYHYRARIYSPTLGRFLQTDPTGYGDGMNLYAYVRNDPVNSRDPSGLFQICARVRVPGWVETTDAIEVHPQWNTVCWESDDDGGGRDQPTAPTPPPPTCPPPAGTRLATQEEAALAAARAARAAQHPPGGRDDNNERSFRLLPTPDGGHTWSGFTVGTPDNVDIVIYLGDEGGGHVHTAVGGDRLSRATDSVTPGFRGDVEQIRDALNQLEQRGQDTADFMSVLVGDSGNVYAWFGRNLTGQPVVLGRDRCP